MPPQGLKNSYICHEISFHQPQLIDYKYYIIAFRNKWWFSDKEVLLITRAGNVLKQAVNSIGGSLKVRILLVWFNCQYVRKMNMRSCCLGGQIVKWTCRDSSTPWILPSPSMTLVCSTEKKSGVSGPDWSAKCAVVLNIPCKKRWCSVELCPAWPMLNHVEQRPVPPPPGQATGDSVYLQLPRGMYLDVDLRAAHPKFEVIGKCSIVLNFSSSNTVFWNTPKWFICITLIVVIFRFD